MKMKRKSNMVLVFSLRGTDSPIRFQIRFWMGEDDKFCRRDYCWISSIQDWRIPVELLRSTRVFQIDGFSLTTTSSTICKRWWYRNIVLLWAINVTMWGFNPHTIDIKYYHRWKMRERWWYNIIIYGRWEREWWWWWWYNMR